MCKEFLGFLIISFKKVYLFLFIELLKSSEFCSDLDFVLYKPAAKPFFQIPTFPPAPFILILSRLALRPLYLQISEANFLNVYSSLTS